MESIFGRFEDLKQHLVPLRSDFDCYGARSNVNKESFFISESSTLSVYLKRSDCLNAGKRLTMPELSGKYSEASSPRKRRRSRSSSGSARSRSRERVSSPATDNHRHNGTDERKSKWSEGKERSRNRFRVGGSRSRSRSREREKLSWADERDRGHYAGSRSDYYDKRDDIQRQRQEAFIAR